MQDHYDPCLYTGEVRGEAAKRLFSKHVENVIVETFSRCNRSCSFCPSPFRTEHKQMDMAVFGGIVEQLASAGYERMVCLQGYNEPLLEKALICEQLRTLRAKLPTAYLYFSTNGDLLTREALQELDAIGLNRITVSVHPGATYSDVEQFNAFHRLARKTGLRLRFSLISKGSIIRADARFGGIDIHLRSINFSVHGANRAGLLPHIPSPTDRQAPCSRPTCDVMIGYDGNVYPCCNFVAGLPEHASWAIGSLTEGNSIFDIYAGRALAHWRKNLFIQGIKPHPCNICSMAAVDLDPSEQERRQIFLEKACRIERQCRKEVVLCASV